MIRKITHHEGNQQSQKGIWVSQQGSFSEVSIRYVLLWTSWLATSEIPPFSLLHYYVLIICCYKICIIVTHIACFDCNWFTAFRHVSIIHNLKAHFLFPCLNSLHADYAIAGKVPWQNIYCTCIHSSHAFRKRVWILPVRRNTIEMITITQRKLLHLTSENK